MPEANGEGKNRAGFTNGAYAGGDSKNSLVQLDDI